MKKNLFLIFILFHPFFLAYALPSLLIWLSIECSSAAEKYTTWNLVADENVCSLFPNGAKLRKPGSCTEWIICQDGKSTPATDSCTGGKLTTLSGTCGSPKDDYCTDECKAKSPTWISGNRNCHDWIKCDGSKVLLSGTCPSGQVFDAAQQKCYYPKDDYVCDKEYKICDIAAYGEKNKFWDKDNCHKYFYCNKISSKNENAEQKDGTCPIGQYYDKRAGECLAKAQVDCYKHPVPDGVCGTVKLAIRGRFVSDQATCNGYFYCADLGSGNPDPDPHWGECPKSYFFDAKLEACRPRTEVACDEDRCIGRPSGYELAPIPGCQHYLNCENGYTLGAPIKCDDGKYFDVSSEQCVEQERSYTICAL